jgi:flavin reductase (DIM6/NTAB) family NADH-FMN oxidoreductase RutF
MLLQKLEKLCGEQSSYSEGNNRMARPELSGLPKPEQAPVDVSMLGRTELRRVMGRFATGVTVVTTKVPGGKLEGVTSNSFSTVSLDPPLVLWSLARNARSFAGFAAAPHFVINVLGVDQIALSKHFAAPSADKLSGIEYRAGHGGCPVLTGTIAHFECQKESTVDGGDHIIFIGRVLQASFQAGEPLIFAGGHYQRAVAID